MADQELQVQAPLTEGGAFLAVIERASRDPSVDVGKMQALLAMRMQIMAKEAEIAYSEAMSRLQPRLPVITKSGKIEFKGVVQSRYAKYEDIDEACRPLLSEEGFSVSYDSELSGQNVIWKCIVSHRGGHQRTYSLPPMPNDTSGSKNAVQAVGSTNQYAKRYSFCNAFNIVTKGADDDGQAAGWLTGEQLKNVEETILACEMTPTQHAAFLKFAEANSVKEIRSLSYERVMTALRAKEKQHREGVK